MRTLVLLLLVIGYVGASTQSKSPLRSALGGIRRIAASRGHTKRPAFDSYNEQPAYGASDSQSQFGAPAGQQQYGAPAGQSQFGMPSGQQQQYGAPAGQSQFGMPAVQQQYGMPTGQPRFGGTNGQAQFGAPTGRPPSGAPYGGSVSESPYGYSPSGSFGRQSMTHHGSLKCYTCGTLGYPCPEPFSSMDLNVETRMSHNGWCETISSGNSRSGSSSRGPAAPGHCSRNGCSRKHSGGVPVEVCCCNRNHCNTGIASTKLALTLLGSALALLLFHHLM